MRIWQERQIKAKGGLLGSAGSQLVYSTTNQAPDGDRGSYQAVDVDMVEVHIYGYGTTNDRAGDDDRLQKESSSRAIWARGKQRVHYRKLLDAATGRPQHAFSDPFQSRAWRRSKSPRPWRLWLDADIEDASERRPAIPPSLWASNVTTRATRPPRRLLAIRPCHQATIPRSSLCIIPTRFGRHGALGNELRATRPAISAAAWRSAIQIGQQQFGSQAQRHLDYDWWIGTQMQFPGIHGVYQEI